MRTRVLLRLSAIVCLLVPLVLLMAVSSAAQTTRTKKPVTTPSRAVGATVSIVTPDQVGLGQTFNIELQVDMGKTKYEDGSPARLGGYVVSIGYDPSMLDFVSAEAGQSPPFNKEPAVTDAVQANEKGIVIATAYTVGTSPQMSSLSVAKLTFRAKKNGAAVFTLDPTGAAQHVALASQIHNNTSVPIPASYKNGAVSIGNSKRTTRPPTKSRGNPGQ